MLSPSLCAIKVIRIELREADAQDELKQRCWAVEINDPRSWLPAKGYNSSWEESTALASNQALRKLLVWFLEGTSRWLGTNCCGKKEKGALLITKNHTTSTHQCWAHPPQVIEKEEEALEKEDGGECSVIHNLFVTGRKSGLIICSQIDGIFLLSPHRAGPLVPSPIKWEAIGRAIELINKSALPQCVPKPIPLGLQRWKVIRHRLNEDALKVTMTAWHLI